MTETVKKDFKVKFGKKILHSLSTGMYANSFFLFREYIQNAADSIREAIKLGLVEKNEAQILVSLQRERDSGTIIIHDNGCGVPSERVAQCLINVGDSKKDPNSSMGRFGIGRMGGLGYCRKLRFETSAKGEAVKSIVEWDAEQLVEILADIGDDNDAEAAIDLIVSYKEEPYDRVDDHFFTVTMEEVNKTHVNQLLDEELVREYIAQVAPVPYNREMFRFHDKIERFLTENNIELEEFNVLLNGCPVCKCYEDTVLNVSIDPSRDENSKKKAKKVEIQDVCCFLLKNINNHLSGWGWVAITDCDGVLGKYSPTRCIRLRHWNIQIGEANCLSRSTLWKEERGNTYFIGEIHALDKELYPNARRDYFEENSICRAFENSMRDFFDQLNETYRTLSKVKTSMKKIEKYRQEVEEISSNVHLLSERSEIEERLDKAFNDAQVGSREFTKIKNKYNYFADPNKIATSVSSIAKDIITRNIHDIKYEVPKPLKINEIDFVDASADEGVSEMGREDTTVRPRGDDRSRAEGQSDNKPTGGNHGFPTISQKYTLTIVKAVLEESLSRTQSKELWHEILSRHVERGVDD